MFSLELEQARRPDILVVYDMNDQPVTEAHGGPVRLYVAPMYFKGIEAAVPPVP